MHSLGLFAATLSERARLDVRGIIDNINASSKRSNRCSTSCSTSPSSTPASSAEPVKLSDQLLFERMRIDYGRPQLTKASGSQSCAHARSSTVIRCSSSACCAT
jgi:hypothetical protein